MCIRDRRVDIPWETNAAKRLMALYPDKDGNELLHMINKLDQDLFKRGFESASDCRVVIEASMGLNSKAPEGQSEVGTARTTRADNPTQVPNASIPSRSGADVLPHSTSRKSPSYG